MSKLVMILTLVFSAAAFATKTKPAGKTRVPANEFAKPESASKTTEVNTNMGWPSPKSDLNESPEQVRAKWKGFTPERDPEIKLKGRSASAEKPVKPGKAEKPAKRRSRQ